MARGKNRGILGSTFREYNPRGIGRPGGGTPVSVGGGTADGSATPAGSRGG